MMGLDPHSNRPRGGPIPDVKRTSQRSPEETLERVALGAVTADGGAVVVVRAGRIVRGSHISGLWV